MAQVDETVGPADYRKVAEAIETEWKARKERRKDLEKHWQEVDRQLRMEPDLSHKMGVNNAGVLVKDPSRAWMPEIELPLQAGALETLLADVRRMRYPSNRDWFGCRAALSPAYFEAFKKAGSPFFGERGAATGDVAQDDADKLVQGFVSSFHSIYDFRGHMDLIDAQALSYGAGVGRLKRVKGRHLGYNAKKQARDRETPVLVPRNIKHVYLDDSRHALMHEGFALGPAIMQQRDVKLVDLNAAAAEGEGYIRDEINRLTKRKDGTVTLVELEGDFAFDRGAETVVLQDMCLTIAYDDKAACLVRVEDGEPFSTYLVHQYHLEGPQFTYASSPLLKGMPVAKTAAQALNRVLESALLQNFPPLQYSPDDPYFSSEGGPNVAPKALWKTVDGVTPADVGGDPQVLFAVFSGLVQMYQDVTGVTAPRLGAETKSHTTGFAKEVELQRGQARTVDYVQATLEGQMTRLLELEYRMGLEMMSGSEVLYIQEWNEFVEIKKGHLPDVVRFLAIGSDAPAEEQSRVAERLATAQAAFQLDASAAQMGHEAAIKDHKPMIEQMLRDGGWQNVEELFGVLDEAAGMVPEGQPGITREPLALLR